MRFKGSLKAHAGWWNKPCRDRWPLSCYWTEGDCDVVRRRVSRSIWRRWMGLKLIRQWAPAPPHLHARSKLSLRILPKTRTGQAILIWLPDRSEEHTSELQSPYVISYAVFCL